MEGAQSLEVKAEERHDWGRRVELPSSQIPRMNRPRLRYFYYFQYQSSSVKDSLVDKAPNEYIKSIFYI